VELIEYLVDLSIIRQLEVSFGFFKTMLRSVFSEMSEALGHLWADDISAMTKILEGFDPDDSCPFDSRDKQLEPDLFGCLKHFERKSQDWRQENADKLEKAEDMRED
jgi:hypothetical protein